MAEQIKFPAQSKLDPTRSTPATVGPGTHKIRVITTSVRTTNRMNALLNESIKRGEKSHLKRRQSTESDEEEDPSKCNIEFFRTNFNMEKVFKILENTIEERFQCDRGSRLYDPYRAVQLVESLSTEIKDKVKRLKYKRHRIVCFLSVIEKRQQGVNLKMAHSMDPKMDNFSTYTYERASFFIVATVFLVYKD